jgi:hypothetical protein
MSFQALLEEAKRFKALGDFGQAGEKLWGAATMLIRLYAAAKGKTIRGWSLRGIERFITEEAEEEHKPLLRSLLDKAYPLREAGLDEEAFSRRWGEAVRLIAEAGKIFPGE